MFHMNHLDEIAEMRTACLAAVARAHSGIQVYQIGCAYENWHAVYCERQMHQAVRQIK